MYVSTKTVAMSDNYCPNKYKKSKINTLKVSKTMTIVKVLHSDLNFHLTIH